MLAGESAASDPIRPSILVVHSYSLDYSWTKQMHDGVVSLLEAPEVDARYRVEFLDAKHQHLPDYQHRLLDLYREKFADSHFDGIILTDDHALNLVAKYKDELFPKTPIVACGINDQSAIPANSGDMNIIVESVAHAETLALALRQNPETHTISVLIDHTLTGQAIRRDFEKQTKALAKRVKIDFLPIMTADELVEFARTRRPGELIYLLVYFTDKAGQVFEANEIPRLVADASPVPVYVAWDFQMDTGVVGGCVTSAFGHGQKAAQTLLDRLANKNPPHIYNTLAGVNRHTYDYNVLKQFDIPLSSLPDNSLLLHRPVSYFEAHRSAILSALAIITILGIIIMLLIENALRQHKINLNNTEIMTLNREVIDTQLELMSTLGQVIETRSNDTANHVRRVAAYSVLLGRRYGMSEEEILLFEAASPMHDVGKIGIPDNILHKPGKLTPEEYEIIKNHTIIGEHILHKSDRKLMACARTIAIQHHERWDGTGYPCGLRGEEINIFARISTLADVYDALSLSRVYKPAWPKERVLNFIRQERGGMFDPQIVDLFFANLDEVDAIRISLSDRVDQPPERADIVRPVVCRLVHDPDG